MNEFRQKSQVELLVNIGKAHERLERLLEHHFYADLSKFNKTWQESELLNDVRCHLMYVEETISDVLNLLNPIE